MSDKSTRPGKQMSMDWLWMEDPAPALPGPNKLELETALAEMLLAAARKRRQQGDRHEHQN